MVSVVLMYPHIYAASACATLLPFDFRLNGPVVINAQDSGLQPLQPVRLLWHSRAKASQNSLKVRVDNFEIAKIEVKSEFEKI